MSLTTDPNDPRLKRGVDKGPGPQNEVYLVLSEEERAKGFVRPLRRAYRHVGIRPKYPLRDLTPGERAQTGGYFDAFEAYPPGSPEHDYPNAPADPERRGRYWTKTELKTGCGHETRMGLALCETYARDPKFYGATYCCHCAMHLPVEQFVWVEDGAVVGT